ncbi:hypothetical protein ACU686_35775 [Yinghuangia aomiensis]
MVKHEITHISLMPFAMGTPRLARLARSRSSGWACSGRCRRRWTRMLGVKAVAPA